MHYAMKVPMALQEHKLPLLTMLLPASLKRRYSALHANLKQNQQKLVSIADVRATLRHIATMNRPDNVGSGMRNLDAFRDSEKEHQISRLSPKNADDDMSNGSNGSGRDSGDSGRVVKSYSLFDVIPAGRSCEDVGIERIHCLCMDNDPFLN